MNIRKRDEAMISTLISTVVCGIVFGSIGGLIFYYIEKMFRRR